MIRNGIGILAVFPDAPAFVLEPAVVGGGSRGSPRNTIVPVFLGVQAAEMRPAISASAYPLKRCRPSFRLTAASVGLVIVASKIGCRPLPEKAAGRVDLSFEPGAHFLVCHESSHYKYQKPETGLSSWKPGHLINRQTPPPIRELFM
jgi:hypothetical protein